MVTFGIDKGGTTKVVCLILSQNIDQLLNEEKSKFQE